MTRRFLFSDEAGDFAFKRGGNASKYFILCTVTLESCDVGEVLHRLRRQLAWEKMPLLEDGFHASHDRQAVRDRVFEAIRNENFRVDAIVLEKSKAQPHIRASNETFYKYAWWYHFKHIGPQIAYRARELHITTASVGTKKGQAMFTAAVNDVVQQVLRGVTWVTTFTQSATDPCLQLADYCTWAIQRKWERDDTRSYALIQGRIASEFNLWRRGTVHYYSAMDPRPSYPFGSAQGLLSLGKGPQ
jgi:Protein of unknown function (DUF3800)